MAEPEIWSRDKIIRLMNCDHHENPFSPLNSNKIPEQLRKLIPYAEIWGLSDDGYRDDLIESASRESLQNLADVFIYFENALMDWLAGPEADSKEPTKEYVAFSALLQAGEFAAARLENLDS